MSFRLKSAPSLPLQKLQPIPSNPPASALSSRWRGALARSLPVRTFRPWSGLATCLMYHRICPDQTEHDGVSPGFAPNSDLSVTVSAFDDQIAFVAQHFNCVSLPEAIEQLACGKLPERSLIVTFDDGYLDNLTLALPVLRRHGVPATVYIATDLIDQAGLPWWYELEYLIAHAEGFIFLWRKQRMQFSTINAVAKRQAFDTLSSMLKQMEPTEQDAFMALLRQGSSKSIRQTKELMNHHQLYELANDPLITIGAHTHHHLALSCLCPIRLRHEMIRSKELLESWLKRPIEHLAYPYGGQEHASTREFSAAAEIGFASAVTTRLGHIHDFHRDHLQALPRIGIDYGDCMARFEWKISGLYSMVRRPSSRWGC